MFLKAFPLEEGTKGLKYNVHIFSNETMCLKESSEIGWMILTHDKG
jgi:hypothetical protein